MFQHRLFHRVGRSSQATPAAVEKSPAPHTQNSGHLPPKTIFCDNGSEFVGRALDLWAYVNKVRIDFSRPGKPTDNAHVESFNGRLREECLNSHWFISMQDAKRAIEAWRTDYNENRPHRALENRTPLEFAIAARNYPCSNGEKTPETLNQTGTKSG